MRAGNRNLPQPKSLQYWSDSCTHRHLWHPNASLNVMQLNLDFQMFYFQKKVISHKKLYLNTPHNFRIEKCAIYFIIFNVQERLAITPITEPILTSQNLFDCPANTRVASISSTNNSSYACGNSNSSFRCRTSKDCACQTSKTTNTIPFFCMLNFH